ncbi:MAG: FAD-dependent oxidoreductase [Rudaea sp.]|uniref:FAD-dependent oxidoreductase n=1 Tax=Rudaea sp. TaxID=2136325 RepID=UPI0039E3759E
MSVRRSPLRADVAVVGGGAAGIGAALGAAACGARVALIEAYGFLGGTATVAGVQAYCGFYTRGAEPKQVVAGVGQRVLEALQALGHDVTPKEQSTGNWILLLDPERLKRALDGLVLAAGVEPLLHCRVVAAEERDGRIDSLLCADPQGLFEVHAKHLVDATGNANLAALTWPERMRPRRQAATLTARLSGLDPACAYGKDDLRRAAADYQQRTGTPLARGNGGYFVPLPWSDACWAMMVDVDLPDCTSLSLAHAEMQARAIAHDYLLSLRRCVPGFAGAQLEVTGPALGIRATQHIASQGDAILDDLVHARRHTDGIARSGWPGELHPRAGVTEYRWIAGDDWFHVRYGALQPDADGNLWLAGSSIGADDAAFGSIRVMGCAFATGQAAGVAAALSSSASRAPLRAVQQTLIDQGALL